MNCGLVIVFVSIGFGFVEAGFFESNQQAQYASFRNSNLKQRPNKLIATSRQKSRPPLKNTVPGMTFYNVPDESNNGAQGYESQHDERDTFRDIVLPIGLLSTPFPQAEWNDISDLDPFLGLLEKPQKIPDFEQNEQSPPKIPDFEQNEQSPPKIPDFEQNEQSLNVVEIGFIDSQTSFEIQSSDFDDDISEDARDSDSVVLLEPDCTQENLVSDEDCDSLCHNLDIAEEKDSFSRATDCIQPTENVLVLQICRVPRNDKAHEIDSVLESQHEFPSSQPGRNQASDSDYNQPQQPDSARNPDSADLRSHPTFVIDQNYKRFFSPRSDHLLERSTWHPRMLALYDPGRHHSHQNDNQLSKLTFQQFIVDVCLQIRGSSGLSLSLLLRIHADLNNIASRLLGLQESSHQGKLELVEILHDNKFPVDDEIDLNGRNQICYQEDIPANKAEHFCQAEQHVCDQFFKLPVYVEDPDFESGTDRRDVRLAGQDSTAVAATQTDSDARDFIVAAEVPTQPREEASSESTSDYAVLTISLTFIFVITWTVSVAFKPKFRQRNRTYIVELQF